MVMVDRTGRPVDGAQVQLADGWVEAQAAYPVLYELWMHLESPGHVLLG